MSVAEQKNNTLAWLKANIPALLPRGLETGADAIAEQANRIISTDNPDRAMTCQVLPELVSTGLIGLTDAFALVRTGLLYTIDLPENSRINLLMALAATLSSPANDYANKSNTVSSREAGELMMKVLEETAGGPERQERFTMSALEMIAFTGYLPALPVVQALADKHPSPEVGERARKVSITLKDTVRILWHNTQADLVTGLAERASILEKHLDEPALNTDERIQALFDATKNTPFEPMDPRMLAIERLLFETDEKLRLAAAFVIVTLHPLDSGLLQAAIRALAEIGVNGRRQGCCREASLILEEIEKIEPELKTEIELARQAANARFLERFGFKL
ncbi:MAG: hypothetical protein KC777_17020 [Cyanobacteria bacterium HKST-UBA02]|nr:hypothetical protein [Cyanobacteria bacterium HKST-UBA02]